MAGKLTNIEAPLVSPEGVLGSVNGGRYFGLHHSYSGPPHVRPCRLSAHGKQAIFEPAN